MSPHSPPQLMASPPSSLSPPLTPSASAAAMTNNISQLFGLTNAYFLSNLEMAKVQFCRQIYGKGRGWGKYSFQYWVRRPLVLKVS